MTAAGPPRPIPHIRPDGSWEPLGCGWCGARWAVVSGTLAACATHYDDFVARLREQERGAA